MAKRNTVAKKNGSLPALLDEQLCFQIYSTSLAMNKVYRSLLKDLGITYPQYLVLLVLWETDGMNVSAIGDRLFLDSATLTPLLKRMEAADLLERSRDPQDERSVIISLTRRGLALKQKVPAIQEGVFCAGGCSVEDLRKLSVLLGNLRRNLAATTL